MAATLMDGALGTELLARGLPEGTPPEAWVLSHPDELRAVHAAYARAGAVIQLSCTFGALPPRLAPAGLDDRLEAIVGFAVRLAREAAPGCLVAGSVGPTGLAKPGEPLPSAVEPALARTLRALRDARPELLWFETQYHPEEVALGLRLAGELGLRAGCTLALVERDGRLVLPDGSSPLPLLAALARDGAAAVGVNCVDPGVALERLVRELAAELPCPVAVRPSAGRPGDVLPPADWAAGTARLVAAGASLVGGCCQAGPSHVWALAAAL